MNLGADIFTVRTGRATVMIGLPASLAAAGGEFAGGGAAFGGPDASQLIDLALEACGETHGVRQFCIGCGFPSHGVAHVGNRGLRNWLVNAVRQGRLAAVLLPDVLFDAGPVQARTVEVRTDFAMRTNRVVQAQAGAQFRPLDLIEAMQAEAGQRGPGQRGPGPGGNTSSNGRNPPLAAPAGARPGGGQEKDLTPSDVRAMALEDRILEVIRRALVVLEASADFRRQDLEALVAPNRLAGTVAVLTAWADSHLGDVRALTDLALRAFGRGGLGEEMMFGLLALSQALARTRDALDRDGLEKAANRLARAITLLGPALERLITCSTTLPVAVPAKARAHSLDRTPTRPLPERYWPRPAPEKKGPSTACIAACQQLQKLQEARFYADFSDAGYAEDTQDEIHGYKLVKGAELKKAGLKPGHLTIPGSSFNAVVYEKDGNYIVAFQGTTSFKPSHPDMQANLQQKSGIPTPYYTQAQKIAVRMSEKLGGPGQAAPVRFVGHSLGGGLASAAAVKIGAPATTYNAAGLHPDTVTAPRRSGQKVTAVRVNGEGLTGLQNTLPIPKAHSTEVIAVDPPFSFVRDVPCMIFAALLQPLGVAAALLVRAGILHTRPSVRESLDLAIKSAIRTKKQVCGA